MKRENRRCQKCHDDLDVKVVSLRHYEYHNPAKLVTLCRVCRRASWNISWTAGPIIEEQMLREWLANGKSGLEEERERLLARMRSSAPQDFRREAEALGPEGLTELLDFVIQRAMFDASPMRPRPSPWLKEVLERWTDKFIPEAFFAANSTDS